MANKGDVLIDAIAVARRHVAGTPTLEALLAQGTPAHEARRSRFRFAMILVRERIVVHEKWIEIRWRDVDAFGHVNNAVFLTYFEEVRDEWVERVLGGDSAWDFVIARVAIDFRRELTQADDKVVARCRLERIGTSSVTTREELTTASGELAAEAETVLVARDRATGRSRPLTDEERAALERAT